MTGLIDKTRDYVRAVLSGDASGHDWQHIRRVTDTALRIAASEPSADARIVELAALLHDIADYKMHDGDTDVGPRTARDWLMQNGCDPAVTEAVVAIVRDVSFKGADVPPAPLSLEGQIVQDADRLDAIGAIGIARAFAYGGAKGRPIYAPDVPAIHHDTFAAYQASRSGSLNHFYEKLLLLKDRMNTPAARAMAEERHAFMLAFLSHFHAEWGDSGPILGGWQGAGTGVKSRP